MTTAALQPQSADGLGSGALLSLVVHGGLIGALALGVSWRQQTQVEFSAELWSSLPQVAAPPAPAPEPAPPPPSTAPPPPPPGPSAAEIALEKEKARAAAAAADAREKAAAKAEKAEKAEKAAKDKADRERREAEAQAAADKKLEAQREENLKRLLAQAGGSGRPGSTGTAAQDAAPSRAYAGLLIAHIRSKIVMPDKDRLPKSLEAVVEVRSTPTGTVLARRLVKSSGNPAWDDAVLRAIDRAGTLPRDVDGRVPTSIEISFRPDGP